MGEGGREEGRGAKSSLGGGKEGKVERGGESGEGRGGDRKEVSKEYRVLDVHVVEVHEHW